jgi:hypothetical protein
MDLETVSGLFRFANGVVTAEWGWQRVFLGIYETRSRIPAKTCYTVSSCEVASQVASNRTGLAVMTN